MSFWKPGSKQRDEVQQKNKLNDEAMPAPDNRSSMQKNVPEKDVKTSLSKGVMTMKFMKRKADADLEAITAAEKRRRALDSSWISDGSNRATLLYL
jgi:M-phase phosphoprotein 6